MKMNEIINYLDELFPDAVCELNYNKDYELLIAVMLSAQTTDKRVNQVTSILFKKYPTLEDLKNAEIADVSDIIRPIGTYNKKAINVKSIATKLLEYSNGIVPNDRDFLESLNGVGRKTANVVLGNLYSVPCIAVDTHVSRVSKRLGLVKQKADVLEIEKVLTKKIPKDKLTKMHHQLVLFGRYHCKAINPECSICRLCDLCKFYKNKKKTK